ncbi:MAG TPA: 50S ribosomal protein L3 N(5)-glutamine methyltransferase [Orrella sp.]
MSDPCNTLITVRDWLRYAVSQMHEHRVEVGQGTQSIWDDAVFLVLRTLHLPIDQLDPFLDARLLPHECERLSLNINQRCLERIPTAYLVQEAWLAGYRFRVDAQVLIPRSPVSELLSMQLLPWIDNPDDIRRIADVCTGSGCLAILAALSFPQARVDATDLSESALQLAQANINDYGLEDRVELHQGDLLHALPENTQYDLIICNPPYVNADSMSKLPAEFEHEPSLALAGGTDGMDLVRDLIADARHYLTADGVLILEIGHEAAHFEAAFPDLDPLWLDTAATERNILLLGAAQLPS